MLWFGRAIRARAPSHSVLLTLTALLAMTVVGGVAEAQDGGAQSFAEQARDAFVAGEYVEALALYEQAFELDPHPVIVYNQARCYEELGDLPRALERFRAALELNPGQSVSAELRTKIAEIEAALREQGVDLENLDPESYVAVARLSITSAPGGAAVTVDGESVGSTPIDGLFVSPGDHRVEIVLEGYQDHIRSLGIEAGRNVTVHATLRRLSGISDYTPPNPGYLELTGPRRDMAVFLDDELAGRTPLSGTALAPGRYQIRVTHEEFEDWTATALIESGETVSLYADSRRLPDLDGGWGAHEWGVAAAVGGGVLVAAGAVFGVLALADSTDYADNPQAPDRDETRNSAQRNALIADVSLITGGALLVTSAILLFVVDDGEAQRGASDDLVRVDVVAGPSGWGIELGGRF